MYNLLNQLFALVSFVLKTFTLLKLFTIIKILKILNYILKLKIIYLYI